jgi:hypothetical protein
MSETREVDEALRRRALEALGQLGDALAREALEAGAVAIEHDVLAWEGSHGTMHGHRVVVLTSAELSARLAAHPAAMDGLAAALSSAMAVRPGHAVADIRIEVGTATVAVSLGPYRDPC